MEMVLVQPYGHDPESKTAVIFGPGGIGRLILPRLKAFRFKGFIYNNMKKLPSDLENECTYLSFNELLTQTAIISVNILLNQKTWRLLDSNVFKKMTQTIVIVNTTRGAIIDEPALINALNSGKVKSPGLGVREFELQV